MEKQGEKKRRGLLRPLGVSSVSQMMPPRVVGGKLRICLRAAASTTSDQSYPLSPASRAYSTSKDGEIWAENGYGETRDRESLGGDIERGRQCPLSGRSARPVCETCKRKRRRAAAGNYWTHILDGIWSTQYPGPAPAIIWASYQER